MHPHSPAHPQALQPRWTCHSCLSLPVPQDTWSQRVHVCGVTGPKAALLNYLPQSCHLLCIGLDQHRWPWKGDGRSDFMHWLCVLDSSLLGGELRRKKAAGKVLKTACFPFNFLSVFRAAVQGCMSSCWDHRHGRSCALSFNWG